MKTKYEYVVVNKDDGAVEDVLPTREMARSMKQHLKQDYFVNTKIIQNKYTLETSKEVR